MPSPRIDQIRSRIAPMRDSLLAHPVYGRIDGLDALRVFMEHHAFAVWDFMSLLKALQRRVCCVGVPWTPPTDPSACRMINEIVLGEESDDDGRGGFASHFDLYLGAMRRCGASTAGIDRLVRDVRAGAGIAAALASAEAPASVRDFVGTTFAIIDGDDVAAITSSFAFGREDLLPDVFRRIVDELDASHEGLEDFRFYLDRHIALDGDSHGPMAERLIESLCGDSSEHWRAAEAAAVRSLEARKALWDGVCDRLAP